MKVICILASQAALHLSSKIEFNFYKNFPKYKKKVYTKSRRKKRRVYEKKKLPTLAAAKRRAFLHLKAKENCIK